MKGRNTWVISTRVSDEVYFRVIKDMESARTMFSPDEMMQFTDAMRFVFENLTISKYLDMLLRVFFSEKSYRYEVGYNRDISKLKDRRMHLSVRVSDGVYLKLKKCASLEGMTVSKFIALFLANFSWNDYRGWKFMEKPERSVGE